MKLFKKWIMHIKYSLSLLIALTSVNVSAIPEIELKDYNRMYKLNEYVEFYEDKTNNLTIDDIRLEKFNSLFGKDENNDLNFGFSDSSFWFRISIKSMEPYQNNWLIVNEYPLLDNIELYILDENDSYIKKQGGDFYPFNVREIDFNKVIFPINIKFQEKKFIYVKIESQGTLQCVFSIMGNSFENHNLLIQTEYFYYTLYGIILVMLFYNFLLFIFLRDYNYLRYILYLFLMGFTWASLNGHTFQFFWNDNTWLANISIPIFMNLTVASLSFFSIYFLQTKKNIVLMHYCLIFVILWTVIFSILALFISYNYSIRIVSFVIAPTTILLFISGAIIVFKGYKPARYFTIAFLLLFVGVFITTIKNIGILPANLFTDNIGQLGVIFEVVLISLALGDRIHILKEEKEEARKKILMVYRKAKKNLENNVKDRTLELSTAYQKLKQLDQAKTQFFANISHEFRTPLTLLLAPLESIQQGEYGDTITKQNSIFKSMTHNGVRLLKLINNLLDYSKIEAGKMSVKRQKTDIAEILRLYTSTVKSAVDKQGLHIMFDDLTNGVIASIDRDLMEKAIFNLISNAIKFSKEEGNILLQLDSNSDSFSISVKDEGIGIPENKLSTIFDRFSQVDGTASRKYEGTGIGLALSKEIVELHNGTILVKSKLDKGTTFTITIPFTEEETPEAEQTVSDFQEVKSYLISDLTQEASESDEDVAASATKPDKKVLIVEDTKDMREFLRSLLEKEYHILTAANGVIGLQQAQKHLPDLILSDVMMPEMDGYELTQKIKSNESLKHIPVILLTAKADVLMKVEGLEYGADDYLAKPFNSKELRARIKSQLKMKELRDQSEQQKEQLESIVQEQVQAILKSDKIKKYIPAELVDSILKGDERDVSERRTERKKLTIFFSDIKDFTRTTDRLEPEELSELLNHYLSEMTSIIEKHGGTVDKFIGDAIMVHFGAFGDRSDKENAVAAVAMSLEMQRRMRELQNDWRKKGITKPFEIRCGINTGYCTVGNFGSESRIDFTIIGSEVNLAARLESAAEPGGVLVAESTKLLAEVSFEFEDKGEIVVRGFVEVVKVFGVVGYVKINS